MKQLVSALAVVIIMLSGFGALATGQESKTIPISGQWDDEENPDRVSVGDTCKVTNRFGFGEQFVVRDETDTIIAVWTVEGTWEKLSDRNPLTCTFDFELPVPDAAFYTVFLGSERVYTFGATEFPITEDTAISIIIPDSD